MRTQEKIVPSTNPFAKMGLKSRAIGQAPRQTPTATWEELVAFRNKAKELRARTRIFESRNGEGIPSVTQRE
jgi:hypothetical protein